MPPTKPADSFAGAEGEARQQRLDALKAVAQYGRAGLEQGLVSGRALVEDTQANNKAQTQMAGDFQIPDALRQQLAQGIRSSVTPFADDARAAQATLGQEFKALAQGQDTYFSQVAEAVPALRAENQQMVEQYRQAYEERQAEIRAEAEQKAEQRRQAILGQSAAREQMAQSAQIAAAQRDAMARQSAASQAALAQSAAAQLQAIRASAPLPYQAPPPPPPPPAAAPSRPLTMREKGYNPRSGRWER